MPSEAYADRRNSPRRPAIKPGKIVFNRRNSVLDCTLRNISHTGAMISVPNATSVPAEFELHWDNQTKMCTVLWRKVDKFGVRFED